ncbi:MAG: hypothetical protein JW925_01990 [Syntrophaceae bacterium]|nr:hypothetical protein [Syntrophaceae bacterium]
MSETQNRDEEHAIPMNGSFNTIKSLSTKFYSFLSFTESLLSLKYLRWLFIFLLPALFLLKYPVDNVDYDVWWHMALGKYYVTHKTLIMDHSIFSWTPTDSSWIYNTCLGSVAIYLFYNLMGGFGLWLMHTLIFGGIFLSFYLLLRVIRQRLDINSVTMIAAIAIACSPACRYYKPELFSLLMFCWMVFIFFYIKITGRKYLFYLYPIMFALWVNLHGAYIVGLVFLVMAFSGECLNKIVFTKKSFPMDTLVHLGIAMVLSILATLLNPYGVDYLASTYMGITSELNTEINTKYILAYVSLWTYLKNVSGESFNVSSTAWIMTLMIITVIIFSAYELIKKKSCDFAVIIISIALYWKGMETSRAAYFFPVAFFFIIYYLMIHRLRLENGMKKAALFSLLVFSLFFAGTVYYDIRYGGDMKWFGRGLDSFAPVKEVDFLKKYKIEGPIFNDYVVGGYLMWSLYPDYKVFIDPRCSPYIKQVIPDYLEFTTKRVNREDIRLFRKKYPFKLVILHYRQMALIFDFLKSEDDEWRLLYFEKNAAVLMHKSLLPVIKSEIGSENLSPLRFSRVKNPDVLVNVFNFYVRLNPEAGRYIYGVFRNNVSDFYKFKQDILNAMDVEIKNREKELQYKKMWLSP